MKLFRLSTYRLYRPDFLAAHKKLQGSLKVMVMSDLHFSYQVSDLKLQAIIKQVQKNKPSYILIPGDLIDTLNMVDQKTERQRLLDFLEHLGKMSVVILSLGNHDMYLKPKQNQSGWQYEAASDFYNQIRQLDNVFLLDNQIYEDDNIYCLGYTQSPAYYKKGEGTSEDLTVMLDELANLPEKYLHQLPKNKLKFALVHSPGYLND